MMELGAFSVSLNVADLATSEAFYNKLGFSSIGGDAEQGCLILRSGSTTIGLFHGMFDRNMLTFNPGWDAECQTLGSFEDVRQIQRKLLDEGLDIDNQIDETGSGPASIMVIDPDGNPILLDQHV